MFTGIVEGIGTVQEINDFKTHLQFTIQSSFSLQGTRLGDSIAVNGCCLTVTSLRGKVFGVDVSPETLACTNLGDFSRGEKVNLERALRVGDRLGGHFVQGHVDGVGKIQAMKRVETKPQAYDWIQIAIPQNLKKYMVHKGSVTVDGISLTLNRVSGNKIELCIIPHTQERTTLTAKKPGARVNLEADVLVKHVEKLLNFKKVAR